MRPLSWPGVGDEPLARAEVGPPGPGAARLALSVVVPVYNQESSIVENVRVIRERVAAGLAEPFELVVVSDGSVDETGARLLEERGGQLRVIHYDRNLGKGYALKAGALAARGDWIAYVDADLDLDPASIPEYLEACRERGLDFAIGSKRHPASTVHYPRSRVVASWCYQQLVRLLFSLDVRDTQVGLKVFRGEIADEVLPLLLVKRFAFDLELLAVSRSLGYARIEELPVRLDYRFTGSGVGSIAVARALVDTAAIFYRLRILRTYARKRRALARGGYARQRDFAPLVTVVGPAEAVARLDYPHVEPAAPPVGAQDRLAAARAAHGTVLAFLDAEVLPAGNWVSAAVPFLADPGVAAVVAPTMAPPSGAVRERAAAALRETRVGGGARYFRFTPGNLRYVRDLPATSIVVRRADFLEAGRSCPEPERLVEALTAAGKRVLYTPETVLVSKRAAPADGLLAGVERYGRFRGATVRRRGPAALRLSSALCVLLVPVLAAAVALVLAGGSGRLVGIALLAAYAALVASSGVAAALRFRSLAVGAVAATLLPATHLTYAAGFVRGLARGA